MALDIERPLVLIVEDDKIFRRVLVRALDTYGFDTRDAENGMVAKTIFDLNLDRIKIIISDIRMPELDGIGFLAHVRKSSQVAFILMTGFSEIIEVKDAYALGATDFVAKPFSTNLLKDIFERCLNPEKHLKAEEEHSTETKLDEAAEPRLQSVADQVRYFPIHIDEFVTSKKLSSDIYIKLSESKFVKIAHKGEEIPIERLKIYQEKRVDYIFVTPEDFAGYVDFNVKLTSAALGSRKISRDTKLKLLRHTTETMVEKCFLDGINPEIVGPAQKMIEATVGLISNDADCLSLFANLNAYSNRIYAHSVAVAIYSCMVARAHGWTGSNTLFRIAVASLLHDIGMKELPEELLNRNRLQWTPQEISLMETHPVRGRDIIAQVRNLPEDISQIVYQHHETTSGTGYPHRKSGGEIHPLARLIGTVDGFIELVIPPYESAKGMSPNEALNTLYDRCLDQVDGTFLNRLKSVVGFRQRAATNEKLNK
jgi:response regulator RpfG family c-di-GMP phosphodiesterase